MPLLAQVDVTESVQQGLTTIANLVPTLLAFLAILVIGYIVAKVIAKAIDKVLERVGFDRWVERGGVKKALDRSRYDASDILSKIVFYALFLFVLQLAFGVWGPNPISDLIQGVISFLPRLFVAIVIVVIASAIAAAVREIIDASLGGLSYGRMLANGSSVAIIAIGVFAALNQLRIAPAIVNGLFYALLAVVAGSAIIAIGGGGIAPMRSKWEQALDRVESEAPRLRAEAQGSGDDVRRRKEQRKQQASTEGSSDSKGASRPADTPANSH